MRRLAALAALLLVSAACTGDDEPPGPTVPPPPATETSGVVSPPSTSATPASPTESPVVLPPGTPATYADDVAAGRLHASALIPRGTEVEEAWVTDDPEALVIAYVEPGADPFRSERGVLEWRRTGADPPWRAVAWFPTSAETGVLGVDGLVVDVTDDGLQDLLLAAYTGGSGACARWSVVDVQAAAEVFGRDVCDGRIDPSVDPVGLSIDEAVYRPGDPHCCPSAFRTTVLAYASDGRWTVASKDVRDAA
jgi:hypothetical protein